MILPSVSVVIPTRNRPHLVCRAVESVLTQTFSAIETIVVIDGPDEETVKVLQQIADPRLRTVTLPNSLGGAGARNAGVDAARGMWIAFLDDDDEWLPEKIERQLDVAAQSVVALPIIACPVIARRPQGEFIYPRRLPNSSEPISEYLLARNSLSFGEGLIQTSGILTKRKLLQRVPFRTDLKKHQDWDWLLRASQLEEVSIQFVPVPLAIWYRLDQQKSVSSMHNWQYSLNWIRENQSLVTPRAYASFLLVEVGAQAASQGQWREFFPLLWEAVQRGRPAPIDFLLYLGVWFIPRNIRHLYRLLQSKKSSRTQSISSI